MSCPGSEGHFSWAPAITVSTNSNILQATLHLAQPMQVHISANSSALPRVAPLTFRTGFFNQPNTNVMWTWSYRRVTLPHSSAWMNFGSTMGLNLPAGDHTFYWKIWISGNSLTLSAGTMLVEAFRPSETEGIAALAEAPLPEKVEVTEIDEGGEEAFRAQ